MSGGKGLRAKGAGITAAIENAVKTSHAKPLLEAALSSEREPRTGPGKHAFYSERVFEAEKKVREAQQQLETTETERARLQAELEAAQAQLAAQSTTPSEEVQTQLQALAEERAQALAREQEIANQLKEAESKLEELLNSQPIHRAKLVDLHEVPGRRRKLTEEQFSQLVRNLENNPLTHPITVRRRPEGGFEIISGHNRVAAFHELGRDEIDIHILDLDEDEVERAAFYANLLAPSLPDYHKYLGYKSRMERHGLTQEAVAAEAGVDRSLVSKLMAFGDLPPNLLEVIATAPDNFGATFAVNLAKYIREGKAPQALEAVKQVAAGTLTQTAGERFALQPANPPIKPEAPKPVVIKQNGKNYCQMQRADKVLRLSFADATEAASVMAAIEQVLQARAKGK